MNSPLYSLCKRAEVRRRLVHAIHSSIWAAGAGVFAAALAVIVLRSVGRSLSVVEGLQVAAGAAVVGMLAGFLSGWVKGRKSILQIALDLDERFDLKTRLSTALSFQTYALAGVVDSPIASAVIRDAESCLPRVNPNALVEWRLRNPSFFSFGALLLMGAVTLYYPQLDLLGRREALRKVEAEKSLRKVEAAKLEDVAKKIAPKPQDLKKGDMLSQSLEQLANELRDPKTDQMKAMLKVSDMKQKLEQARENLKRQEPKLNPSILKDLLTSEVQEMARSMLGHQFDKAAKLAEALASKLRGGEISDELKQQLAKDFEKLAEALKANPELAEKLQKLAEQLKAGATPEAAAKLDELKKELEKLAAGRDEMRDLEAAAQALEKAQKNLGQSGAKDKKSDSKSSSSLGMDSKIGTRNSEKSESGNEEAGKEASDSEEKEAREGKQSQQGKKASAGKRGQGNKKGDKSDQQSGEADQSETEEGDGKDAENFGSGEAAPSDVESGNQGESIEAKKPGGSGKGKGKNGRQGSGSGTMEGNGAGPDWGKGTTNEKGRSYETGNQRSEQDRNSDRRDQLKEEEFMKLYGEKSIQANTFNTRIKGQTRAGPNLGERSAEGHGVTRQEATAPQGEVLTQAGKREKQALDHQDIPLDYKDAVRRYFDSIEVDHP